MKYLILLLCSLCTLQAQSVAQIDINQNNLPAQAGHLLRPLNVGRAKVGVVLRAIAQQSKLNLSIQDGLDMMVDEVVNDIAALDAVVQLCLNNGLRLKQQGNTFRVERMPTPAAPQQPEQIPEITYINGKLSWALKGESADAVARRITEVTGTNVTVMQGVQTQMRGFANQMEFEDALRALAQTNGLKIQNQGGYYTFMPPNNAFMPTEPQQQNTNTAKTAKLIRLKAAQAEPIHEMMPLSIKGNADVQLVKEQNGFMVYGTSDDIIRIEQYITALDIPAPQILIEAIAVDFRISNIDARGLSFGRGAAKDSSILNRNFWNFGIPTDSDGTVVQGTGGEIRRVADIWREFLGIGVGGTLGQLTQTIGRLPTDFYIRLQYLTQSGNAEIRSRPQISTLNGHNASISIGETQYYLLNTSNYSPYGGNNQSTQGTGTPANQQTLNPYSNTQRFEQIEAKVSLSITPWVSASGEITAEIKPEFSTPVGKFDPKVPPTISSRVLSSTVRLRDGETIILGGLITEIEEISENKVPFFHKIPLIGKLFRTKKTEKTKQELIIFVTPHVFYGDERDAQKWIELQQQYQIKSTE
jgi:type IV pilus assembly protein PilQ